MSEKSYAVQIPDPARKELEEIAQLYLLLSGKRSAQKTTDKIFNVLEQLAIFPLSGPSVRESDLCGPGYRFIAA